MEVKAYLLQLRQVKIQQKMLQEEIDELTIRAGYGSGRQLGNTFASTCKFSRMENAVLDKLELLTVLQENLVRQDELERSILSAINAVEDMKYQSLLLMRYVRCYSWEKISFEMSYSLDNVYKLHVKALQSVQIPEAEA